jgi:hypothetical protein
MRVFSVAQASEDISVETEHPDAVIYAVGVINGGTFPRGG